MSGDKVAGDAPAGELHGGEGMIVNLAPDLTSMVERLAKQANLSTDEVIVRALLNQQLIIDQKTQGRSFQVKDKKAGIATVDFV